MATLDPFAVPIATDPDTIRAEQIATLQLLLPQWRPVAGALDNHLLAVTAETSAESRGEFGDQLRAAAMTVVGDLYGIPKQDGLAASSTITVTAIDTAGYTLDAGSTVYVGETECETDSDLVILPTDDEGTVGITAVNVGADVNGLDLDPEVDPLDWIDAVVLDDPLAGGVDEETDIEYALRLREEAQTLKQAIVRPEDGAIRARRNAEVTFAYAVDHYNATTGALADELTFSIIVANSEGTAITSPALVEIQADVDGLTHTNLIVVVTNATYTAVNVTTEFVAREGWADADVEANIEAAIDEALSPVGHLTPPSSLEVNYLPASRIHKNDVIAAIYRYNGGVNGVLRLNSLTLTAGADYVDMASPKHLPSAGTKTVTPA